MKVQLPDYAEDLFKPYRYKVLYGGRGSSKSWTVARVLIILSAKKKLRILCSREFQNSISESVHKLLKSQIDILGLEQKFKIGERKITGVNGSEFIFKGLFSNITSIKSMEGIDIIWLEEAQTVSKNSWDTIIPTLRKKGSEIWVTYNPENLSDPTYMRFHSKIENAYIRKINWRENPFFPSVLKQEKDHLFRVDPDLANHVWEGHCRVNSDAQIFKNKWLVESFDVDPRWDGPYVGVDWGFSRDPTVMMEVYIDPIHLKLMIRREAWGLHIDISDLPDFFKKNIPVCTKVRILSDNSRPETISYIQSKGLNIGGARKWKGSVEDGIDFLKSFEKIVIHSECIKMKDEANFYRFKVDRLTDEVKREIKKEHDHCWDAVRYALDPLITASGVGILDVLG